MNRRSSKNITTKILSVAMVFATVLVTLPLSGCGAAKEDKPGVYGDLINSSGSNSYNQKIKAFSEALEPMFADKGTYRSAWKLDELYADEDAFYDDYNKVMDWVKSLGQFEGKLSDVDGIKAYFDATDDEKMNAAYDKMLLYTELGKSLDINDTYYADLSEQLTNLETEYSHAVSYASPEIMEIPFDERVEIFSNPVFSEKSYYLSYYTNPDAINYSKETRDAIATLTSAMSDNFDTFRTLRYSDYKAPEYNLPDGRVVLMDDSNYGAIMTGNFDRQVKIDASQVYVDGLLGYAEAFAALINSNASDYWAKSKLYKFDTTLDMSLDNEDIEPAVFDKVIKSANDSIPDYQRYLKIHKEALGLDKQYVFDLGTNASKYEEQPISFDAAIDLVGEAIKPLGQEYVDDFFDFASLNHIDATRGNNRETGSYCMGQGKSYKPYVFLNYNGAYQDASTLAHETGHAMNYILTQKVQPSWYADVTVFNTEVCSIMHELLLNSYMISNAKSDEEKLFYLDELLETYSDSFFLQCMYSEFEDYIYKEVESGKTLSAQKLNDEFERLFEKYRGDEVTYQGASWMNIDHLFLCYYMYKYATSICYASSIASDIIAGDQKAVDAYLKYMSAGSSMEPADLFKLAGIDTLSDGTYDKAVNYYSHLVDEYEQLVKNQ